MSELAAILEALKGLSPLLYILGLLLIAWVFWLKHVETKAAAKADAAAAAAVALELKRIGERTTALGDKTVALDGLVKNIASESAHMLAVIESHESKADNRFERQVDVLGQIHEQLVRLNAAHATVINPDNAKRIIQYQWAWCRDETARLIVNSIRNNSFRGREDIVARKVYDVWRKAAEASLGSLLRLEGLQYPYKQLYTSHLAVTWELIWSWAVPLYHSNHADETFDSRLVDLEGRVKTLFDQVISLHYELVEDIDHGLLYADRRDQKDIAVIHDLQAPARMGTALKDYKNGTTDRMQDGARLRDVMSKAILADRALNEAPVNVGLRTKSGTFELPKQG